MSSLHEMSTVNVRERKQAENPDPPGAAAGLSAPPPPHRVPQAPQDTPTLPGQDTQALQGTQEKQRRLIFSEKQVRMFSSERVLCASCEPVSWQVDVTRQRRGEGQVY